MSDHSDARLANEDARECDGGCGSVGPNGERCQGCDHGQYTRAPTEEPALPSPSGPSEGARSICVYCRRATPDGYDEHPECVERAAESGLAERSFDAQDGLLGGQVLGSSVTLGASHVPDESCDRPEVVRKFVGSGDAHAEDGLSPAPPLDDLRVTESLRGVCAGVPISSEAVGRSGDSGDDCFHNPIIPYVSSRGDAGPDAETLAAPIRDILQGAEYEPHAWRIAMDSLSGLVALVEQLTEERDHEHAHWLGMRECYDREVLRAGRAEALVEKREREIAKLHEDAAHTARTLNDAMTETFAAEDGARQAWRERAEKAEALLALYRQTLGAYVSALRSGERESEQMRELLTALAASAPGTEET